MKKIEGSENALLTFGLLLPVGAIGALICLLVFIIMSIFGVLTFIFLLLCGFFSLTYGYLSRIVRQKSHVIKVDVELSQLAMPHADAIRDEGLTVSRVRLCDYDDHRGSARVVMEYRCTPGDLFWIQDNAAIRSIAIDELEKMGLATSNDIMAMKIRRLEQAN